jgi:integrase/recombinase XerD
MLTKELMGAVTQVFSAFAIQKLMRHQNIAVTMKYVAMWGNELREQNDKYNPLNTLDV